nr:putative olfactory receptor 3A4 [Microcebus murinus]
MDLGASGNDSVVTEFVLLGITDAPALQPILFVVFLLAYVATIGGNFSILAAIFIEPKLHTPMYFFLGNLSLLEVGCISVTVPAMLRHFISQDRSIPYRACLSQLFFFHLLARADCFLLTVMAYDRYLAICQPLTYSTRMGWGIQQALMAMSCAFSFTNALTQTVALSTLQFCGPNVITHFYICQPLANLWQIRSREKVHKHRAPEKGRGLNFNLNFSYKARDCVVSDSLLTKMCFIDASKHGDF